MSEINLNIVSDSSMELTTPVINQIIEAISPTASVERTSGGATITITDKNGTTTATVNDGVATGVIDDTAGSGDTNKTWSADKLVSELSDKYDTPEGGIPSTDLSSAVQTSLGLADTAYQAPSGGIPSTDLASAVQTSLGKADTAYQKPSGGISSNDMTSAVQSSLGLADTAYQKPSGGIPATDIAEGVIPDVSDKMDAPSIAGTEGQVLTSDGEGGYSWEDPTGGDPTEIIDDEAGAGDTDKVFSADKLTTDFSAVMSAISAKDDELTKSYTTVIDTTITTVDDGEHESPYATYANATVQETYRYRVTFDGVSSELGAGSWFVPTEQNGHKGYEFLGNVSLYDSEAPNVEKNDSTKTYCIVHNSVEYSGLQILTTVAGSHTLKIEKVNYSKGKYPSTLIYGDEDEFIRRQGSSTSYKSIEIGNNASEARGTFSAGYYNKITGEFGGAIGVRNVVTGANANAVGVLNTVSGDGACAENYKNIASGKLSHAEGETNTASGQTSHAEGGSNTASGNFSHAEGNGCTASGNYSHAEGQSTNAVAHYTHTEGYASTANGQLSHAEGQSTVANGLVSHAEGYKTIANGRNSHTSGMYNIGDSFDNWSEWVANTSYAVGDKVKVTTSSGGTTTVKGYVCKTANSDSSFTSSNWNAYDYMNYAEIIGNGTAENARSNARTLDWDGNERLKGNLYVGCNADSTGGTMIPHDVQVNGTSVVTNGVANVPVADSSTLGVVKIGDGLRIDNSILETAPASDSAIKAGTNSRSPITPNREHSATFYGLAKCAGDSSQSSSSNAVGVYTDSAKVAIQKMLGIYEAPWELIREDTVTNATEADIVITVDGNGNAFELTDVLLQFETPTQETASAKGYYGITWFYYNSSEYVALESGAWTQAANASPPKGTVYLIENRNGMILGQSTTQAQGGNASAWRSKYQAGFPLGVGVAIPSNPIAFNKINIRSVTGTGHYKLYGKRKWTV